MKRYISQVLTYKQNAEIGENVMKHQWKRLVREQPEESRIKIQLLKCGSDDPPTRKNGDVHVECEIECRVTTPFEELPYFEDSEGETWREIHFELEMRPCGTMLEFAAYYNGRRQPPVRVHPPCANAPNITEGVRREDMALVPASEAVQAAPPAVQELAVNP